MSKTIHTPQLADITEHSPTSATFVIEPLHTGYGMTLGNSLRRVLLSSIAGAAVTAFKIEGATHIETYWVPRYVDAAVAKLTPFYARTL